MVGRCGSSAFGATTSGFDHVRPSSSLRLTTVPSVCAVRPRLHARYTILRAGSAAIEGASSKPYRHAGGVIRRASLQRPETPSRVDTTMYGVMSSPHGVDARNASTCVVPTQAMRGACSAHDPTGSRGGAARLHVRPSFSDVYEVKSFAAPTIVVARDGSIVNDASFSFATWPRVMTTFAPPSGRVFLMVLTTKWTIRKAPSARSPMTMTASMPSRR